MRLLASLILVLLFSAQAASAQVPGGSPTIKTFATYNNWRAAPTSGVLTGTYITKGAWVQTGPITCNRCRLFFANSVTFNDTITVTAGVEGNAAPPAAALLSNYSGGGSTATGRGPGGGFGWVVSTAGGSAPSSGGGNGGAGGAGANNGFGQLPGGIAYPSEVFFAGSSAGAAVGAGTSGNGGGGLYIESLGNISITSAAVIAANGGNSVTNGGGGSGGTIKINCWKNITEAAGATITATGGNGTTGGGGGGGGRIEFAALGSAPTIGTAPTAAGGTSAGGGASGSAGVVDTNATFTGSMVAF